MTLSNWIELVVIMVILVAGALLYRYSKRRVDDLESDLLIRKKSDIKGTLDDEK